MAGVRINMGYCAGAWLAAFLGMAVLGESVLQAQTPPAPPPEELVTQVRVVGHGKVPVEKILPHIKTRAGRPFNQELIEEDVRRLNRTRMFVNVKPYSQRVEGGRVVIFEVLERPFLQYVKYVGNQKINKNRLEKESGVKEGDALDPFAVEEGRRNLEDFYRSKGFANARVTVFEGNKPSDRGAIYLINEGQKQRILWTQFVGNSIATDARLRTQIRSKPGFFWVFKGEVDRKQIDEDVDRLVAYYRSLGFFRARVGRELRFNDSRSWLVLNFVIDEGPRYEVRNVSFIGNQRFSTAELAAELKLKAGQHFDQAKMGGDLATIRDKYGAVGHIFANVKADPRFLEQPGQLDLVYDIREGERYRVGRIDVQIKGENPHTRITTVLNRISLRPGDLVDIRELRASERRLRSSGLFESNPQSGMAPKIVFTPPGLEDLETEVARQPEGPPRFRGQSPDPRRPDRLINLGLQGRWNPQPPSDASLGEPDRRSASPVPARTPPTVIRGQYDPDAGRTIPQGAPVPTLPPYGNQVPMGDGFPTGPALPPPGGNFTPGPFLPGDRILGDETPLWGAPPGEELPLYVPLKPEAWETRTGRLMFSVGVNSDAGLLGSVIVDEQNFDWTRFPQSWEEIRNGTAWRGAGQRFRMEAVPGTEVQKYTINFQEPYLRDTPISLGLSGYFYNRRFREWDEERLGGRVALGYRFNFNHDLSGTFAFRGAKIQIYNPIVQTPPELAEVIGQSGLYGFSFRLAHDTRDNAFLATEGHLIEMGVEQVIGSYDYTRGDVDLRKYFLLHQRPDGSGRHVLSVNGRMAITTANTPIYEHYYAGGFSTIRGFDFRGASPRNMGVTVGGHFQLLASMEYLFPITADDMIRGVVFCDTGTVEPAIDDWQSTYRVAPGLGLRITVPAMGPAPIALDFAFPISKQDGDETEVFSFFVGFLR